MSVIFRIHAIASHACLHNLYTCSSAYRYRGDLGAHLQCFCQMDIRCWWQAPASNQYALCANTYIFPVVDRGDGTTATEESLTVRRPSCCLTPPCSFSIYFVAGERNCVSTGLRGRHKRTLQFAPPAGRLLGEFVEGRT